MKSIYLQFSDGLRNNKPSFMVYWQLFVGGTLFVFGLWSCAIYVKQLLIAHFQISLYSWTDIFFNPQMSRFLNYIFAAVGLAFYYFVFFSEPVLAFLLKKSDRMKTGTTVLISLIIILVLAFSDFIVLPVRLIVFLLLEAASLLSLFFPEIFLAVNLRLFFKYLIKLVTFVFVFFIAIEVINLAKGPVLLMNEYQSIYSETKAGDVFINNKAYLSNEAYRTGFGPGSKPEESASKTGESYSHPASQKDIALRSSNINSVSVVMEPDIFKALNLLEYIHQDMTRGQIDHISYIINPLNEYYSGKKAADIYFQYGYGNTLFFGYIMRLFGGLSIENYYKCYLIYLLYAFLLLASLYYVFRNYVYVCGAFTFYIIAFFFAEFIGFLLAPGIIPSIHMFDVLVIPLILCYFRRQRAWALLSALSFALLGFFFNKNFGGALFISTIASLIMFFRQNRHSSGRLLFKSSIILSGIVFVLLTLNSAGSGSCNSSKYNLLGLFSFKPSQGSVVFTIFYFLISYFFLHYLRKRRDPLKYLFVFTFIYTQFLFLYFFWAGLNNHLLHVIQFSGFQLFLMLYILENSQTVKNRIFWCVKNLAYLCATGAIIYALVLMGKFYSNPQGISKKDFTANFINHRTFVWNLERANLISTINPQPIMQSISLINKYNPKVNSGIYIISKYDNLLPFLAKRYSLMPSFYLQGYLRDNLATERAVFRILQDLPEYIYADSDLNLVPDDPWRNLFRNDTWLLRERQSRFGRYGELRRVFDAVKQNYVYADSAGLLTVYKRNTNGTYGNQK